MPDSKLSFLLRWTRPFLPSAERRVTDTRLEPARRSRAGGHTASPLRPRSHAAFEQLLRNERARSLRSGQPFCLLRFTPQDDHTATQAVGVLVDYLSGRLREIDELGWLDSHRLGVVLPYTAPERGWNIVDDVCQHWPSELSRPNCEVFRYPSSLIDQPGGGDHGTPVSRNGAEQNGNGASNQGDGAARNGTGLCDTGNGVDGTQISGNGTDRNGADRNGASSGRDGNADRQTEGMEPFFVLEMPWWKRGIDIIGSVTGLILTSPILLAAAVAIKMTSPGPILFRQRRSGAGDKPFVIYKFRTMRIGAEDEKEALRIHSEQDGPAFKMADDPRVTRLGRLLRQTSIDELPQFWNVLKGEMSLVGPRPLPCAESDASEHWHRRRLDVAPGITGSWQVNGRSSIPFADWARLDLRYAGSVSLTHDLKILVMTIPAVLSRRGAS